MKKLFAVFTMAVCAAVITACGGGSDNVETQAGGAAQTEEAAEALEEEEGDVSLSELYDMEIMEGVVETLSDNLNTVTVTDEEGTRLSFDITDADRYDDDFLMTGSYVEVEYAITEDEVYPAQTISVLMDPEELAVSEDRDPVIYGTLQLMDINDLVIIDETGTERFFNNQMSRTVSFGDIKAGDRVQVTYIGNLLDDDDTRSLGISIEAIKIVSEDALGSDEANADYIIGTVDIIYTDVLTLDTEPETFEVLIDEDIVEGIEENDKVKVYYTGSASGISITATKIEKIEE